MVWGARARSRARTVSRRPAANHARNLTGRSTRSPRISTSSSSAIGAGDDAGIAGFREARAGVVGKLADDLALAAVDDDVGHGLRQIGAGRNRHQMVLPLGAGDLDQRVGAEPAGMGQHLAGHLDLVVRGELFDDLERGVVDRRQPLAESSARARVSTRAINRHSTSSKTLTCSSLRRSPSCMKRSVTRRKVATRLAGEPPFTASSSSPMIESAGCCGIVGSPVFGYCQVSTGNNRHRTLTSGLSREPVELQCDAIVAS